MDAYMHQHLALERRDRWVRAAAASRQASDSKPVEQPSEHTSRRAPARRLRRLPLLRIAR